MPIYRVTDPITNKTIRLTGDSPPTKEVIDQAVQTALKPPKVGEGYFAGVAKNIVPSLKENVKGIAQAVTQPIETAKSLYNVGAGAVQSLIPGRQGKEQYAEATADYFKERYKDPARTFYYDPVGVAGDVSMVAGFGAGTLGAASKVSKALGATKTASTLEKAANVARGVETITDPILATAAGARNISKAPDLVRGLKGAENTADVAEGASRADAVTRLGQRIEDFGQDKMLTGFGRPQTIDKFNARFGDGAATKIISDFKLTRDEAGVERLSNIIDDISEEYNAIVSAEGRVMRVDDVATPIKNRIEELRKENTEPSKRLAAALETEMNNMFEVLGDGEIPVSEVTARRKLYQREMGKYQFGDSNKSIFQEMRDALQEGIYDSTQDLGDAKTLGREMSKLIEFNKKIMRPAAVKGTTTRAFPLGRTLSTVAGGTAGGLPGAFLSYGADVIANDPRMIMKTSDAIRKVGSEVKTFAPKAEQLRKTTERITKPGKKAANTFYRTGRIQTRIDNSSPFRKEFKQ